MSAGHAPKATNMPFGAVGSSSLLTATEKSISLKVTQYPSESAAKTAIDRAKIFGALVSSRGSNTLIVVPSMSDLAPLDLAARFEEAARSTGQTVKIQQYAPHALAKKDPFGLVQSLMLDPLLIGGYMSSTLLMAATGKLDRVAVGFAGPAGDDEVEDAAVVGQQLDGPRGEIGWAHQST